MKEQYKKTLKQKRPGRKAQSSGIKVAPIFKQPLDINKMGNAFLSLALELAKDNNHKEKPEYRGESHEENL